MGASPLSAAFQAVKDGKADTLIILENDLYRRAPRADVDALLNATAHVIVLDHLMNPMTEQAELVLPSGTFAESDGTFISSEGRAQRFFQVFVPPGAIRASWCWLGQGNWESLDEVLAAMVKALPQLVPARDAAPPATFRMAGAKIPRSSHRSSGRTAVSANINVSEPTPPDDPDSPLAFSMEGAPTHPPGALLPFVWSPGWNSIQATNTYQKEIGGPLRGGDPGVRMIEPASSNDSSFYSNIPSAFEPREGEWLLVPMHHIFGSDELSLSAPGIAELATTPYVAVNADELTEGEEVEVRCAGNTFRVPVRIRPDLPRAVAGLPAGVLPLAGCGLPVWGKIVKVT
jgi:NADH-quinone oxidoreductase subunit G